MQKCMTKKVLEEKNCTMYPRAQIYFLLLKGDQKFFVCFGLCCSHQVDIKFLMCSQIVPNVLSPHSLSSECVCQQHHTLHFKQFQEFLVSIFFFKVSSHESQHMVGFCFLKFIWTSLRLSISILKQKIGYQFTQLFFSNNHWLHIRLGYQIII